MANLRLHLSRRSFERLMNISSTIATETAVKPEVVEKILSCAINHAEINRRIPAPERPEGSISLSAAGRKYEIPQQTLSRWVSKGYIPIILRTKREVYVDESILGELVKKYKDNPGQGKRTIKTSNK